MKLPARRKRLWMSHRRAYFPRRWPMYASAASLVIALNLLLSPGVFGAAGLGLGVGVLVPAVRIKIWRMRHPILSSEEYLQEMRGSAMFN